MKKFQSVLIIAFIAIAAFCFIGCDNSKDNGNGADVFTVSTNDAVTNNVPTLGLVGTSASSSDTGVATVEIVSGKIRITSVSQGSALITASDGIDNATINVTVSKNGTIEIAGINKVSFPKLLYQGHASIRLRAENGTVIYVDPYAGTGYNLPADIILVTHGHSDHNVVNLVTQKGNCVIISYTDALVSGDYKTFEINGIIIEAVEAYNANHNRNSCVGYIITIDGIKLYHAGDTSKTDQMATFAGKNLDYALLPCDGAYNMNIDEAIECAGIIGAKQTIPIHSAPGSLIDPQIGEKFNIENRLIIQPGSEIDL
jgi:L-ascorbate metabolism protein UlaG (beta-lactamase superfamily)